MTTMSRKQVLRSGLALLATGAAAATTVGTASTAAAAPLPFPYGPVEFTIRADVAQTLINARVALSGGGGSLGGARFFSFAVAGGYLEQPYVASIRLAGTLTLNGYGPAPYQAVAAELRWTAMRSPTFPGTAWSMTGKVNGGSRIDLLTWNDQMPTSIVCIAPAYRTHVNRAAMRTVAFPLYNGSTAFQMFATR